MADPALSLLDRGAETGQILGGRTVANAAIAKVQELRKAWLAAADPTDRETLEKLYGQLRPQYMRVTHELMMAQAEGAFGAARVRARGVALALAIEAADTDLGKWAVEMELKQSHHEDKMRGYIQRTDAMANSGARAAAVVTVNVNQPPPETILDTPEDIDAAERLLAKLRARSNGYHPGQ